MQSNQLACLICGSNAWHTSGIRGNREYSGADPKAEPHYVTEVLQCDACGFFFTAPLNKAADELEEMHYSRPDSYHGPDDENCDLRLKAIQRYCPTGCLLDIGAGKGEFIRAAIRSGFEARGIEPSVNFAAYASDELKLPVRQGYLDKPGLFDVEKFDVVTLFHVLEHVHQPHELIALLRTYMKEDGLLLIEVPNTEGFLMKVIDVFYRIRGLQWSSRLSPYHPPFHRYGYAKRSITRLLHQHGLDVILVQTYSGFQRKMEGNSSSLLVFLRNTLMRFIHLFGNRELLLVLAKPIRHQGNKL